MADISGLERRLTEALERMRHAHLVTRQALSEAQAQLDESGGPGAAAAAPDADAAAQAEAEIARLSAALEAAREEGTATARGAEADRAALDEARQEAQAMRAAARLEKVKADEAAANAIARQSRMEAGLDQLRQVNAQLRQNNDALRQAYEDGVTDPELVNVSLKTELEALKAARDADRAEIDGILTALKPLMEETEDA
jgi:DNA repair exonuclease SbcCD ATPase subunit